jgi:hypothetical protein
VRLAHQVLASPAIQHSSRMLAGGPGTHPLTGATRKVVCMRLNLRNSRVHESLPCAHPYMMFSRPRSGGP